MVTCVLHTFLPSDFSIFSFVRSFVFSIFAAAAAAAGASAARRLRPLGGAPAAAAAAAKIETKNSDFRENLEFLFLPDVWTYFF